MSPRRLPEAWINRIFSAMQGHYGTRWLNMWRIGQALPDGQDAGVVNAKLHWAEKLGGFNSSEGGAAIKQVLNSLPNDPPSLPVFHNLVRAAYQPAKGSQLEHKASPEELEEQRQRIEEMVRSSRAERKESVFTLWYEKILNNPKKYPSVSLQFAKEAFKNHNGKEWAA